MSKIPKTEETCKPEIHSVNPSAIKVKINLPEIDGKNTTAVVLAPNTMIIVGIESLLREMIQKNDLKSLVLITGKQTSVVYSATKFEAYLYHVILMTEFNVSISYRLHIHGKDIQYTIVTTPGDTQGSKWVWRMRSGSNTGYAFIVNDAQRNAIESTAIACVRFDTITKKYTHILQK